MRQKYCQCGRKIVVRSYYGKRIYIPQDDDHLLCQQCYRSERDRTSHKGERSADLQLNIMDGTG